MEYIRLKRLLYSFAFLDDFVLIYVLYAVLFASHGLNAAQISSLYIVWSLTAFVFEVPAGPIADKYPRRLVLLAATFVKALGFAVWLIWPDYLGFLAGFLLWGVSGSLASGTEEALVYDELQRADKSAEYTRVTGRMGSLRLAGIAIAGLLASALANHGYAFILALSIFTILLSGLPIYLLPKAPKAERIADIRYLNHIHEGVRLVLRNRKLLFIVLYGAIVTGLSADEYYGLIFRQKGFSTSLIALALGLITVFGAIGSSLAHRLEGRRLPLGSLLFGSAICLLLAAMVPGWFTLLLLGVVDIFSFAVAALFNGYAQRELTDRHRATATSVSGLLAEAFALVTFAVFAVTSLLHSYSDSLAVFAAITALLAITYGLLNSRFNRQPIRF